MTPRSGKAKAAESFADLGLLGSAIIVFSWVSENFFNVTVPPDVQFNAGILIMVFGGAVARLVRHKWRYGK